MLYAREVEGRTAMELAEREGISPRTVKRRTREERVRLASATGQAA
jgi:DNA-directed RNA polymerase specialized sigma24 family protein